MSYTLLGSQTSPFVRRIRMLLETIPYEFKELNIFETEDAQTLNKINPVNQIPVLLDGEAKIWDSRQIFNYINLNHKLHNMDWDDENMITAIDGAMNSGITLLLLKRSDINIEESCMFVNRQKERIESVMNFMKPYLLKEGLKEWNFISITMYCFLDWARFRNIFDVAAYPEAVKFLETHSNKEIVKSTSLPKA